MQGAAARTVLERLDGHVQATPGKPFLVLYRGEAFEVWTYADLAARAARWAGRLAASGIAGRTVLIVAAHGIDAYAAFLGVMRAGGRPGLLPPPTVRQRSDDYAHTHRAVAARALPAAVVAPQAFVEAAQAFAGPTPVLAMEAWTDATRGTLPAAPAPDDLALVQHSSGTTGLKKGVALSFAHVDRHVAMLAAATGFSSRDVVASWLPLYHDMGLFTGFLAPLTLGASVVALDPFAWVADPASLFRAVERHRATLAWTPNFAFAHAVRTRAPEARFDLSSLRMLVNCSEPCRPETVARFLQAFGGDAIAPERIACCYGLAEVVFAATQTAPGVPPRTLALDAAALEEGRIAAAAPRRRSRALLSCGRPLPGVELTIDAPPGFTGEILVRSATQVTGYLGDDAQAGVTAEGFRRSGDVGLLDGGELFVCGGSRS